MNALKVLSFSLLFLLSLPSLAEQLMGHEASSEETRKASVNLSDYCNGSVHCQNMVYPDIELNELFKMLGVKVYTPS